MIQYHILLTFCAGEPNATAKPIYHVGVEVQGRNISDMNEFGLLTQYYFGLGIIEI